MSHSTLLIALVVGSLCCSGKHIVVWTAATVCVLFSHSATTESCDVLTLPNNTRSSTSPWICRNRWAGGKCPTLPSSGNSTMFSSTMIIHFRLYTVHLDLDWKVCINRGELHKHGRIDTVQALTNLLFCSGWSTKCTSRSTCFHNVT